MIEGIYELEVYHARTKPVEQSFRVAGYTFFIDVARFDAGDWRPGLLHQFRRSDFSLIADDSISAVASALSYLKMQTGISADRVCLLANARIAGYVFNPVSFFFYYRMGEHAATVVEVNNTFREQKHFIVAAGGKRVSARKNFYVSPFLSPLSEFSLNINAPGEALAIGIHTYGNGAKELMAEMRGKRRAMNSWNLARLFFKYPFHTLRVIVLIHWYALKLFVRGVPFFPKAAADAVIIHGDIRS